MAQTAEYIAINAKDAAQLTHELAQRAINGWRPILMSSAMSDRVHVVTVILEHKLGS